jgi:4-hydroxy 2-oxovalerate aldolase
MKKIKVVDCTLRDGGYYNSWDFSPELIQDYLEAMSALQVDFVEIGFRSLINKGFKGGCAYSMDTYLSMLSIPLELRDKIGVMVNGSELVEKKPCSSNGSKQISYQKIVLKKLFAPKNKSPVSLVRIACHAHEFEACLPAAIWLKQQGYLVGFNLMQVTECTKTEIIQLAHLASQYPIDVLYFADSMGSLDSDRVSTIVRTFKQGWLGKLGIHTHDSMGRAISNSLQAVKDGVTWVDSTVCGMGRGPGNAQTEYLTLALQDNRVQKGNITKLLELIHKNFKLLQTQYGWGVNPYYYLAGEYGIHPSYVQKMLADCRYSEEDILAVIEYLKVEGAKKFSLGTLETARHFYSGTPGGGWNPADVIQNKDVLIIGSGPSIDKHRNAINTYIKMRQPFVIALNAQKNIDESLIDARAACHPVRLLADCHEHLKLSQPLITPASMLPEDVKQKLSQKELLDFGLTIIPGSFEFYQNYCTLPTSLVVAYALAIATSGQAKHISLVGFDGYGADDPRRKEMDALFNCYKQAPNAVSIVSITPTRYEIAIQSIYAMLG